ncbi:MAG: CBS domain-containing protein [Bryobacteraceae bacterium]|nr:CBS domain-containing protein [Bryobacteraceae bacterium]
MQPSNQESSRLPGTLGQFQVAGVPVRFHFTFWIGLVWLIVIGVGGEQSLLGNAIYVTAIFASVLLHEGGHAVIAKHYGIQTVEIVMLPLGGLARLERQPKPAEEFWVALAGPLVNFVIGAALLGAAFLRGHSIQLGDWSRATDANLISRLAVANLILAFFTLLPAFPMDGGRVVRSLLAAKRPVEDATRITARIGTAIAAAVALYGLLSANFLLVFFAFFMYVGAAQEATASSTQALLKGARVQEAMVTDFRTLPHGATIREAADLLLATTQQDFPVVAGNQVVGLLNRKSLVRAMATDGPDAYVAGAMDREFSRLAPDAELEQAAQLLDPSGGCALVFDQSDSLRGMLTSENLSEFLVLREIRRARARAGVFESPDNHGTT